jgi:tetratricopeptide (TPR) repeat protein
MIFQDERLRVFSELFFQDSDQPTLRQEWLSPTVFDYSCQSLRYVDEFLLRLHSEQAASDKWAGVILRGGAYVGEVIRRNCTIVDYHWLNYDDAVQVNPSMAEFGKRIGTAFALYHAPRTLCFPLARVEECLNLGYEKRVFAFAEVMLGQVVAAPSTEAAESLYQQARQRCTEAIKLSVYDDREVILGITPPLESALRSNPTHIPSLSLLSELLIMLKAYEEAKSLVRKLREIEPDNDVHQTKQHRLEHLNVSNFDECFDLEEWVLEQWRARGI